MMKFLIPTMALLAIGATSGYAADMPIPVKAPSRITAFPLTQSGWFMSAGTHGEAQKLEVSPAPNTALAPTSTFAAGGAIDIGGGYMWMLSPTRTIAIEGFFSMINTGANQSDVALRSKVSATQRLLYLGDLGMLSQWIPDLSITSIFPTQPQLPTCATGIACNPLSRPYVGLVLRETRNEIVAGVLNDKSLRITYGATLGIITPLSNGTAVDTWFDATSSSGAHLAGINGGIVAHPGVEYRAGATVKFGAGGV